MIFLCIKKIQFKWDPELILQTLISHFKKILSFTNFRCYELLRHEQLALEINACDY